MEMVKWDALKPEVERQLRRRVGRPEWVAAVMRQSDDLDPDDACAVPELVAELQTIYAIAGEDRPHEPRELFAKPKDKTSRVRALSSVFAAQAAQLPEVREFRARALPDGLLLKLAACEEWITDQRGEVEPGKFLLLAYAPPDAQWTHHVSVAPDSILGDLRRLSVDLAELFGWEEQQATMFALTGAIPIVYPIRTNVDINLPVLAASRIVLEIDPWTDPRDVEEAYRRVRRDHAGENSRYRPLGERALALATFVAERPDDPDEKRRRAWNRAHKEWKYRDVRAFVRAYRTATNRLLDPKIR